MGIFNAKKQYLYIEIPSYISVVTYHDNLATFVYRDLIIDSCCKISYAKVVPTNLKPAR